LWKFSYAFPGTSVYPLNSDFPNEGILLDAIYQFIEAHASENHFLTRKNNFRTSNENTVFWWKPQFDKSLELINHELGEDKNREEKYHHLDGFR